MNHVAESGYDHFGSDCPMEGEQIRNGLADDRAPESPFRLLRIAYGL